MNAPDLRLVIPAGVAWAVAAVVIGMPQLSLGIAIGLWAARSNRCGRSRARAGARA